MAVKLSVLCNIHTNLTNVRIFFSFLFKSVRAFGGEDPAAKSSTGTHTCILLNVHFYKQTLSIMDRILRCKLNPC